MTFGSTGIWGPFRSSTKPRERQRGFTLVEALVALSIILAVAAALGPLLSQARRIIVKADERAAAQALLRTLIDAPLDRGDLLSRRAQAGQRMRAVVPSFDRI
jgi:prepilin-type N-terminal cleavage/methylation domain-containing protein